MSERIEKVAKKLYAEWCDEQGIHSNRFPAWDELDKVAQDQWRTKAPLAPHLIDCADGVRGRYAVGRLTLDSRIGGHYEFWNIPRKKWSGASDDVLTLHEAIQLRNRLRCAALASQQQATPSPPVPAGTPPAQPEGVAEQNGPRFPGHPSTSRDWLEVLVDIWDETQTHAPEDRSYVPEALADTMKEAALHLKATPPSPSEPAQGVGAAEPVAMTAADKHELEVLRAVAATAPLTGKVVINSGMFLRLLAAPSPPVPAGGEVLPLGTSDEDYVNARIIVRGIREGDLDDAEAVEWVNKLVTHNVQARSTQAESTPPAQPNSNAKQQDGLAHHQLGSIHGINRPQVEQATVKDFLTVELQMHIAETRSMYQGHPIVQAALDNLDGRLLGRQAALASQQQAEPPVAQTVSTDDMLIMAEQAGIAPNTIIHWELAFHRFAELLAAAITKPASVAESTPPACPTYQTTSGDTTICKLCGESWSTGRERACVKARRLAFSNVPRKAKHEHQE